jgi:hypothetical protein
MIKTNERAHQRGIPRALERPLRRRTRGTDHDEGATQIAALAVDILNLKTTNRGSILECETSQACVCSQLWSTLLP